MTETNFMMVLPSYTISGSRTPGPGGTGIFPGESWLTGVQGDEVETVVAIMRRMGYDTISVNRQQTFGFPQTATETPGDAE